MKYPNHVFNNQTKLVALLGHGVKHSSEGKKSEKNQFNQTMKTGIFMIFQGKRISHTFHSNILFSCYIENVEKLG